MNSKVIQDSDEKQINSIRLPAFSQSDYYISVSQYKDRNSNPLNFFPPSLEVQTKSSNKIKGTCYLCHRNACCRYHPFINFKRLSAMLLLWSSFSFIVHISCRKCRTQVLASYLCTNPLLAHPLHLGKPLIQSPARKVVHSDRHPRLLGSGPISLRPWGC